MHKFLFIILILFFTSSYAASEFYIPAMQADELYRKCKTASTFAESKQKGTIDTLTDSLTCTNYIQGVIDAQFIIAWLIHKPGTNTPPEDTYNKQIFCIPSAVSPYILSKVYINFIDNDPTMLGKPAVFALFAAFIQNYPCKK